MTGRPNFRDLAREYLRVNTGWATDKAIESLAAELERAYELGRKDAEAAMRDVPRS